MQATLIVQMFNFLYVNKNDCEQLLVFNNTDNPLQTTQSILEMMDMLAIINNNCLQNNLEDELRVAPKTQKGSYNQECVLFFAFFALF